MKAGTENRTKTIAAGVLGSMALIGVVYVMYTTFFSGSSPTPPPTIVPVTKTLSSSNAALIEANTPATKVANDAASRPAAMPSGNAAGVAAQKMATSSTSLDPTLDQGAMLRTEHLVYAGSGRNIFSAIYVPPVVKIPVAVTNGRKGPPPPPQPPIKYVPPTCPPSCPPINLKFFGTAVRANGVRQAFLLQGDDVFLASPGDIVARKYRIVSVSANSIQVEDMANSNTQTLPLQN